MGVFKNWQGSRRVIHLLSIQLIVWLGWLSTIALAQMEISEPVTGSANFPSIGITCIGNFAVFVTSLLRGRLDLEMGARDVLATIRGPKLEDVNDGFGLTTCPKLEDRVNDGSGQTTSVDYSKASVVMLSNHTPNLSIKQFMTYTSNAYNMHSIVLQCFPVKSPALKPKPDNNSNSHSGTCKCIVFSTVEEVTILLARQIPGTLKRLSDSLFLLPSPECLENGCHGCNQGLLHVKRDEGKDVLFESNDKLSENDPKKGKRSAITEALDSIFQQEEHKCICIPLNPLGYDYWTKLVTRSFRVRVSEGAVENYSTASLLVPRLTEILINLVLTGWFRVDGFSSSLVARRAIREYVVDSKGSGFAANAFLMKALTKVNSIDNSNACQVLTFRGTLLGIRTFSFIVGSVNLFCSASWAVLIAMNGSVGKWYDRHPIPLSESTVAAIMVTIGIILGMDCFHLYLYWGGSLRSSKMFLLRFLLVLGVVVLEIIYIVAGSVITRYLGIQAFGKWLHSVLHVLVWVKWAIGSYLLGEYPPEYDSEFEYSNGILVYSSVFFLNSVLAGVRGKWQYSLEQQND